MSDQDTWQNKASQLIEELQASEARHTFKLIHDLNVSRCIKWHGPNGVQDWSVLEWAGAMCGEAGEAANVAKKIHRETRGTPNGISAGKLPELRAKLAQEIADTFLYLNLLAASQDIDMYDAIARTFNAKSEEYNFPERLPLC